MKKHFIALHNTLCAPRLMHFTMPVIMVYLLIGTVAQKYIGLYQATQLFFADWIIWIGGVPILGMPVFIAILALNLTWKLLFKSPWTWRNAGVIITHIGAITLLLGGLLTAAFSHEGYIALGEGESSAAISDYHAREFVVLDQDDRVVARFDHDALTVGNTLEAAPFTIEILEHCANCKITAREDATPAHQGMAQHMQLSPAPLKLQNEENMAGLTFAVTSVPDAPIFVALEDVPQVPEATNGVQTYRFILRRETRDLPFTLHLIAFEKESYEGIDLAKEYRSQVRVRDGDLYWDSTISMNQPLRYKGYTFYQSSFVRTPMGEMSVFAVVWNVGRVFPYIAGLILSFGLVLHLVIRRRMMVLAVMALGLSAFGTPPAMAEESSAPTLNAARFATLPVLHDGRVKPLDSFARAHLKMLSGEEHNATPWLIEALFDPARAEQRRIIKIRNPDITTMLGLEARDDKRYTQREVRDAMRAHREVMESIFATDETAWTRAQREVMILQSHIADFERVLGSMSAVLPLAVTVPRGYGFSDKIDMATALTYMTLRPFSQDIAAALQSVIADKGNDITRYTPEEQALAHLSFTMDTLAQTNRGNDVLKLHHNGDAWYAPWEMITGAEFTDVRAVLTDFAAAYHGGNAALWQEAVDAQNTLFHASALTYDNPFHPACWGDVESTMCLQAVISTEYLYNTMTPFMIGMMLSIAGLIALTLAAVVRHGAVIAFAHKAAFALLSLSAVAQIVGLGTRVMILQRPPVSTLYETVLFVSAVIFVYMIWAFKRRGDAFWLWLCAIFGILLYILGVSQDQEGDSFLMLGAVLNTNFWLTTHVLCITAGYAFCAATSGLAHLGLVRQMMNRTDDVNHALMRTVIGAALLALFFATIGTVLGGIWADQSWGRFWGWDPKENGALLIVIWLIWVIHGRISGQMAGLGTLCGLAYLSVILALSWFGVNILGVGLHSYGFTDGMLYALCGFIVAETAFVAVAYTVLKRREGTAHG